ncbi:hypothetical protein B0G69_7941 [Paraburkholderia sp. RAU2J]|nr:hypothetical protein [Paraburkholderia sp. RAU2J]RKT10515.1 hypothetical protein B0G69_7941 [Paraburkholderia sp. RAU2J]
MKTPSPGLAKVLKRLHYPLEVILAGFGPSGFGMCQSEEVVTSTAKERSS